MEQKKERKTRGDPSKGGPGRAHSGAEKEVVSR
jgi:hypothetical protein